MTSAMPVRVLGSSGPTVSAIGLGCMGMSFAYGPTDHDEAVATIHRALDLGVTFLDTADVYADGANERLVGGAIAGRRDDVVLATKFGIVSDPVTPGPRQVTARRGRAGRGRQPGVADDDFRRTLPRFDAEHLDANLALVEVIRAVAASGRRRRAR